MRWLGSFCYEATRRGAISRTLGVVILLGLVVYYVPPRQQSFVVAATAEILSVRVLDDGTTEWELPRIQACLRKTKNEGESENTQSTEEKPVIDVDAAPAASGENAEEPDPDASKSAFDWCNARRFTSHLADYDTIRWTEGYTLTFRTFEDGALEVFVDRAEGASPVFIDENKEITSGSILRIPFEYDGDRALMPLRGYVTIGDVPNASDAKLLREGRYEIRQLLGLWRRQPHVVDEGELFPGDRVSFARTKAPFWMRWFNDQSMVDPEAKEVPANLFIAELDASDRAVNLVATTERAHSALCLTRVGGQPTCVPVSWTNRLMADALPVALATFLGIMGSIVALANAYIVNPAKSDE